MARPADLKASAGPAAIAPSRFAAKPDLLHAIAEWQSWLTAERRASPHTIAAYGRDLALFLDFLVEHRGELPGLDTLEALSTGDFRAWLARRTNDDIKRSSSARAMSVLRGFFRFLDRRDLVKNAALAAVRTRVPLTGNATLLVGVSRNGFSPNARLDIELGPEQLLNAWSTRR